MAVPLESLTAPELWPSLARWKSQGGSGKFPQLPEQDEAPWIILDPKHEGGLKNQMNKLNFHFIPESIPDSATDVTFAGISDIRLIAFKGSTSKDFRSR